MAKGLVSTFDIRLTCASHLFEGFLEEWNQYFEDVPSEQEILRLVFCAGVQYYEKFLKDIYDDAFGPGKVPCYCMISCLEESGKPCT